VVGVWTVKVVVVVGNESDCDRRVQHAQSAPHAKATAIVTVNVTAIVTVNVTVNVIAETLQSDDDDADASILRQRGGNEQRIRCGPTILC
jgi:hypothetical protein